MLPLVARSDGWLGAAIVVSLALAALPALYGWVGWLYLPSIGLLAVSILRPRR